MTREELLEKTLKNHPWLINKERDLDDVLSDGHVVGLIKKLLAKPVLPQIDLDGLKVRIEEAKAGGHHRLAEWLERQIEENPDWFKKSK